MSNAVHGPAELAIDWANTHAIIALCRLLVASGHLGKGEYEAIQHLYLAEFDRISGMRGILPEAVRSIETVRDLAEQAWTLRDSPSPGDEPKRKP